MTVNGFWDDNKKAQSIMQELSECKEKINDYNDIKNSISGVNDLIELCELDESLLNETNNEFEKLETKMHNLNMMVLFSGEFDGNNAILDFHPGAGGTESQDWAEMLYRMYIRWAEQKHFKMQVLDYQQGEEAGLKSASLMIKGKNAYGMLKGESGVHRLVRISPFDASGRRHTSFASVEVMPEITDNSNIEILDKDLKIDTYRSQGAGGQNVNKTESAVRITHIPTGIIVSCQVDRSQLSNKEMAMNMLRAEIISITNARKTKRIKQIAW